MHKRWRLGAQLQSTTCFLFSVACASHRVAERSYQARHPDGTSTLALTMTFWRANAFVAILLGYPIDGLYNYPDARAIFGRNASSHDYEDLALYEQFFAGQRNGHFVEIGALESGFSNTFAFETVLNWTGVLIEANPIACRRLFQQRRNSTKLCSSISTAYSFLTFEEGVYSSTVAVDGMHPRYKERFHKKQRQIYSAPLGQLLRAVGVVYADLFSLDVEGSEVKVLETMDWSIPVRVWCIELNVSLSPVSNNESIANIMTLHGYERKPWLHEFDATRPLSHNQLWVRKGAWEPTSYRYSTPALS